MKLNGLSARLLAGLVLFLIPIAHHEIFGGVPNSPVGMLVHHGTAALADFFLMLSAGLILSGELCEDMEMLCLASITANFLGWIFYLSYFPPTIYTSFIAGIGYMQYIVLLLVDKDDAGTIGDRVVYQHNSVCQKLHTQEAN